MTLKTWIFLSVLAIAALIATAHAEFGQKAAKSAESCHSPQGMRCR